VSQVVVWKNQPDEHDYPAAAAYLSLLADEALIAQLVQQLRDAPIATGKAKDLLRASRLALLGADNQHVVKDIHKVQQGTPLSPVLLVRGSLEHDLPLVVADGYHRVCASYHLAENTDIPYKMAALPS
jgi:hypothetical protein